MMKSIVAISAAAFALGAVPAVAADMMDPWSQMLVKPMTPAETAQLKAERDAAKGKWATMTPEERASAKSSMRGKKLADLNVMERIAQEDDMGTMTKDESAQFKADRQAAQAKYGQMSTDEKAAVRKAAQQKRLSDLNTMERVGQENDRLISAVEHDPFVDRRTEPADRHLVHDRELFVRVAANHAVECERLLAVRGRQLGVRVRPRLPLEEFMAEGECVGPSHSLSSRTSRPRPSFVSES